MQVSKNFNSISDRMQCPCCNAFQYDSNTIDKIQELRTIMAIPFYLDQKGGGFFRCQAYQESIGGVKDSQHCKGKAMDVLTVGWDGATKWKFLRWATSLGLSVGMYPSKNFFHIDNRSGTPVVWFG